MDDAQSPPDANNGKGDRARRNLRLRDAESVASMRRDMFGDGSLLRVIGGSPPVPEDTDFPAASAPPPDEGSPLAALDGSTAVPEDTQPPADPAPLPAESEAALPPDAGPDETQSDPAPDRVAAGPMITARLADVPQSLDAIIDSFAAEPFTDGLDRSDQGRSGPTFLAPLLFSPRSLASGSGDQPSEEPPIPAPAPMQVSAIFNGLDVGEHTARETELDESAHVPAFDAPVPAAPTEQDDPQQAEAEPSEGVAESRDPIEAIAEDATFAAEAMQPPSEAQYDGRYAIDDAAPEDGPPAAGGETSWEARAGSRQEPEPPIPVMRGFPAFPGLPGMPSFPEPVQAAAAPPIPEPPQAAVAPPFPAPAEAAAPPFPEPRQPSFREPVQPAPVPRYPEPLERPPFREARRVAAFPQIEPPSPQHVRDAPSKVPNEAAARIAAEATATAEALDNLNRMLAQNVPEPRVATPVWPTGSAQQRSVRVDPAPFPASPAPELPLPVPPEPSRPKGIYLLGFLTGVGLSLMAGVALYVLINTV